MTTEIECSVITQIGKQTSRLNSSVARQDIILNHSLFWLLQHVLPCVISLCNTYSNSPELKPPKYVFVGHGILTFNLQTNFHQSHFGFRYFCFLLLLPPNVLHRLTTYLFAHCFAEIFFIFYFCSFIFQVWSCMSLLEWPVHTCFHANLMCFFSLFQRCLFF